MEGEYIKMNSLLRSEANTIRMVLWERPALKFLGPLFILLLNDELSL
jgi:hypothetical protein